MTMPTHSATSGESQSAKANVVIAFDVDNTLIDADGTGYERTLSEFLSLEDLGITRPECTQAYEDLRSKGDALERLGLRNPINERGNADALAVLCLIHCANPTLSADLGIKPENRSAFRDVLEQIAAVDRAARQGPPGARLSWELAARRYCSADPRVRQLREEIQRLAAHPILTKWSDAYERIEGKQPVADLLPMMTTLASRGFTPVVISEGRTDVQLEKLDRLGLTHFFAGKILITEAAVNIPGLTELDVALSRLIDAAVGQSTPSQSPELSLLWSYRCLIGAWSSKTPAFFARCLHALCAWPEAPQEALNRLTVADSETWAGKPLRFIMVGDRYDKDVLPLIELLGPEVGLTIRLRQGKYAHLHPEDGLPPDRRPSHTFNDWSSLEAYLTDKLAGERIEPITAPPDLFRGADLNSEQIERGLSSPYEAVQAVAAVAGHSWSTRSQGFS